ncbi:MAG: Gfo/Idh/MocA family oxidoreductase [Planctomycetes bacterium]|nr:Gfo/Idh/MocA family oxidoreductase [Planctomycetota bacterium]
MLKAGLIGCGNISGIYLHNRKAFKSLEIVKCADLRPAAAEARGKEFGIPAVSVEDLLADPEIDVVLNLTIPQAHTEVDLKALNAGKHVYSEKPFALDMEAANKVLALAASKNLRVGCAPDTFLGGGHQTCRKLIDDGVIGRVVAGTAFMLCHGHESWHPAPAFYYLNGGGPLFDMGPYYITALVNLLGPVRRVVAVNTRSTDLRIGVKANVGKTFPVEVDTHVSAILEFASGAVITLITSFDVWKHSDLRDIELHGTEGSLHVPDPNCFNGDIRFFKAGLSADWAPADNNFIYNDNMRCMGLADMAAGIERNRPHRCSGALASHVLDVMCSIIRAGKEGRAIDIAAQCERPAALPMGLAAGDLD